MYEDILNHRKAVADNIRKSFGEEIDIEKAHQVGDVHPNGKWVWTQLPSGKFDWRTIGGRAHKRSQASAETKKTPEKKEVSPSKGFEEEVLKIFDNVEKDDIHDLIQNRNSVYSDILNLTHAIKTEKDSNKKERYKKELKIKKEQHFRLVQMINSFKEDDKQDEVDVKKVVSEAKSKNSLSKLLKNFKKYEDEYDDYVSGSKVSKEAKKVFDELEKYNPKRTYWEWDEDKECNEYIKKMENDGYKVVDYTGDSYSDVHTLVAFKGNNNGKKLSDTQSEVDVKKVVSEVFNKLQKTFDENEGKFWKKYIEFGDVTDFNYSEETGELDVYAEGKAYGDSEQYIEEVTKKDWDEYDRTSGWHTNWRGEREPYTTNAHGAIKIAKMLIERGVNPKKIILHVSND